MTPNRTRAEQIVDRHRGKSGWTREASIADVEQALDEAVRDAHHDCTATHHDHKCSVCVKAGTLAGLEMAAGIAESQPITEFGDLIDLRDLRDNISKNILAKAKELENGK